MKSSILREIIFLLFASCVYSKLLFASVVSRHGERVPYVNYNFTDDPKDNFITPGELTREGVRQHYLLGRELRKRYIENEQLVSKTFKNEETFFRSPNAMRNIESLQSQLVGLYPPEEDCGTKLTQHQQKTAIPPFKIDGLEERVKELAENALPD